MSERSTPIEQFQNLSRALKPGKKVQKFALIGCDVVLRQTRRIAIAQSIG